MATETDTIKLVTELEARVRDFEKNFKKAHKVANDNFRGIENRGKQSAERLEKTMGGAAARVASSMKTMAASFAGGFLGGMTVAGIQQIAGRLANVANSVAMIGSQAKMAGVNVQAFQELSYVAEQNRISVDALADGMKELNLRADEWIATGGGAGAESFQRLGFTASDLAKRLKDPSALLVEIIARMEQLDKAAQIRISDELFGGTAGERFVELVDRGASGIQTMIKEAHDFGMVLDEDVIAKADEIDRKFNLISRTVGTNLKSAIVEATGALLTFLDKMNDLEDQQKNTLQARLRDIGSRMAYNNKEIAESKAGPQIPFLTNASIKRLEARNAVLSAEADRIMKILDQRSKAGAAPATAVTLPPSGLPTGDSKAKDKPKATARENDYERQVAQIKERTAALQAETAAQRTATGSLAEQEQTIERARVAHELLTAAQRSGVAITPQLEGQIAALAGAYADATRAAADLAEAQRQGEAFKGVTDDAQGFIAAQQQEQQALGMSAEAAAAYRYELEMLNRARAAGITLTEEQRREIADLATGMAAAEAATRDIAATQERAAELGRMFGETMSDAFIGIIDGSMTAGQALKRLATQLAQLAIEGAFLGSGPFATLFSGGGTGSGLLGKVFGFADGGKVRGPGTSTSDSIPALLSNGEFVINAKAARRFLPLLEAINTGKVPGFATGGIVGRTAIGNAALPSFRNAAPTFNVAVDARGASDPLMVEMAVQRALVAAGPIIAEAAKAGTISQLTRRGLPRGAG